MNFNNNNINNESNNISPNKKETGTEYNISEINNINNEHDIDTNTNNNYLINFDNENNTHQNLNQNAAQFEEEEEEIDDYESNNNNNSNTSSSYYYNKYKLIPTENFSQQVDFLFHPKNPEWQPSQKKKISDNNNNSKNFNLKKSTSKPKINKKKKKSKNKFRGAFGIYRPKNNKKLENRPEFDLRTKIEPTPRKNNLSLFYGTKGDTKYEKQIKLREQKIEQYEEDLMRRKEIYKAKRQREDMELKKNYMNQKYKTSSDFYPKKNFDNENNEFIKQLNNLTKINYPKADLRNYECNPQKYDIIIHSLLSEISQIKLQREKENKAFIEQIKKLEDYNTNKKRPKSSIKNQKVNYSANRGNNSVCKNIKKYFDKNNKKNKRPMTSNKYNMKTVKKIEHEIPVSSAKNNSKKSTKNNYYKNTKDIIMEKLKALEIQKENKLNEIIELHNNNINNNKINNINPNNINQNQNIQNIATTQNIIFSNPQYLNFSPSINTNILNFQDKAQILTELNNNLAKFTSGIPKLMNKVNEALNKIYANTENPIKKAINNHPFVIMASKATHKAIKNNIGNIVESIVDDLIMEIKDDLDDIEEKEKKNIFMNNLGVVQNKLKEIKKDEIIILNKYNN